MLTLLGINKYFNKNKPNQLQALKNISLGFGDKGMAAIYGKSGCGKSTLLNCIGGIEKIHSGSIALENKPVRNFTELNNYKSKNISFIFQDYNLIESLSVEENILLALDIAKLPRSIEKVNIVLRAVKMDKYNKRKAYTLSGGQKQRIAIARALVISPKIILADEPTGNLDKSNSLNILKLLKSISKEILVIIASHDRELVNGFADRIIEMSDGRILSDSMNRLSKNETEKGITNDNGTVYLEDYIHEKIDIKGRSINIFYNDDNLIGCDFIFSNQGLLVHSKEVNSVNICKNLLNSRPRQFDNVGAESEALNINQTLAKAVNKLHKKKHISAYFPLNRIKKISAIVLMFCAFFVALSMSFLGNAINIDETKFRYSSKNSLVFYSNSMTKETLKAIDSLDFVDFVLPIRHKSIGISIVQTNYFETSNMDATIFNPDSLRINVKPLPISSISENMIMYGRLPENNYEGIIDKSLIDRVFNEYPQAKYGKSGILGIVSYKGYINTEILFYDNIKIKIVGISEGQAPTLYLHPDLIYAMSLSDLYDINEKIYTENLADFVSGDIALQQNEILISEEEFKGRNFIVGTDNPIMLKNRQYIVKNYYSPKDKADDTSGYIMTSAELKNIIFDALTLDFYNYEILVSDIDFAIEYLYSHYNFNCRSVYEEELSQYIKDTKAAKTVQLIFTVIIGLAAFIIQYMMVKSILIERRKVIAIKAALGKSSIKSLLDFIAESLIFTTIFAIPVYIAAISIIKYILRYAGGLFLLMNITLLNFIIGIIIIYTIVFIATIIPAIKSIFKTPAKLLKS